MLSFDFITLFPDLLKDALSHSIPGRAQKKNLVKIGFSNPRDFAKGNYRQVDDLSYGGGPGMVLMLEPILAAVKKVQKSKSMILMPVCGASPLNTEKVKKLTKCKHIIVICGRYEGIDARINDFLPIEEFSVGDVVVSGGEIPALMLADAVIRRLPGAVSNEDSIIEESYENGLFDHPHYTRPAKLGKIDVPAVLLSGDHKKIADWRFKQAAQLTWRKRPELLASASLSGKQQSILRDALLKI